MVFHGFKRVFHGFKPVLKDFYSHRMAVSLAFLVSPGAFMSGVMPGSEAASRVCGPHASRPKSATRSRPSQQMRCARPPDCREGTSKGVR